MADSILVPKVNEEKQHPLFKKLIGDPGFDPAAQIIDETMHVFTDIDGNFIEQFQSTAFNQRLWELLLFKIFKENNFNIIREGDNPDFIIEKNDLKVAVEAVTSNPTQGDTETEELVQKAFNFKKPEEQKAAQRKIIDQTTIKLGSALYTKLQKRYWEMEHIVGKPLVFAIEAFHHSHANYFPDYKLISYLYGYVTKEERDANGNPIYTNEFLTEYTYGDKTIPYGFFNLKDAKNVSAVIFANGGNIDKFNRMGCQLGMGSPNVILFRVGTHYTPEKAAFFEYYVGAGQHVETWSEGMSVCHNPNALHPIPHEFFNPNRQLWLTENGFDGHMPVFFPYTSVTGGLIVS